MDGRSFIRCHLPTIQQRRLTFTTEFFAFMLFLLISLSPPAGAQYFKTLYNFQAPCCAAFPFALTQARDTNLYGTIVASGIFSLGGSVYRLTPTGHIEVVKNFDTIDVQSPFGPLTLGTDAYLYGSASFGDLYGVLYRISSDGSLDIITGTEIFAAPRGRLLRGQDGNFYGTASTTYPQGYNLEKITPEGAVSIMYSFDVNNDPVSLVEGKDGNFYGVAGQGRENNGMVFKLTPGGVMTVLYSFDGTHGAFPGILVQGPGPNYFGTTFAGGSKNGGVVFMITPTGSVTVLHEFDSTNPVNGYGPTTLMLASDGYFYGTTLYGGMLGYGVIFRISTTGNFLVLHNFNKYNGSLPFSLMQHTNGKFYGSTSNGGIYDRGTLYQFDWGLKPFVMLQSTSGKVGTSVGVLGNGLLQAVTVSFNNMPAAFNVEQDGYLTATVPTGATSGYVTVTTTTGVVRSMNQFKVMP